MVLLSGLVLGLASMAAAQMEPQQQPENDTQAQGEAFQVTGECMMMPSNQNESESPFMTCQYYRQGESQMDSQSLIDQMMQRMQQMMGENQSMPGMGGQ